MFLGQAIDSCWRRNHGLWYSPDEYDELREYYPPFMSRHEAEMEIFSLLQQFFKQACEKGDFQKNIIVLKNTKSVSGFSIRNGRFDNPPPGTASLFSKKRKMKKEDYEEDGDDDDESLIDL